MRHLRPPAVTSVRDRKRAVRAHSQRVGEHRSHQRRFFPNQAKVICAHTGLNNRLLSRNLQLTDRTTEPWQRFLKGRMKSAAEPMSPAARASTFRSHCVHRWPRLQSPARRHEETSPRHAWQGIYALDPRSLGRVQPPRRVQDSVADPQHPAVNPAAPPLTSGGLTKAGTGNQAAV